REPHGDAARQAVPLRHLRDGGPLQQAGPEQHNVLQSRDDAEGREATSLLRLTAADWLLENARVVTLDPHRPAATALAVAGGRVLAIGTQAEVARLAGRRTERLDCRGATVLPGLVDPHLHLYALAASAANLDCAGPGIRSVADLLDAVRARARNLRHGVWLRGEGLDERRLGRLPAASELEAAAPHHPVRLRHRSRHASVPWPAAGAPHPGPVKIMVEEGPRGLRPAPAVLARRIAAAARSGAQVAVHSLGAATLVAALAAFAALPPRFRVGRRHRLEHVAECPPPLVETIAALGLIVVTNPAFVHWRGARFRAETAGTARRWLYRARSLAAAGVTLAGASDAPVVPPSPWVGIATARTR